VLHIVPILAPLAVLLLVLDGVWVTTWTGVLALFASLLLLGPVFLAERVLPTFAGLRRLGSAIGTLSRIKRYLLVLFGLFFALRAVVLFYEGPAEGPDPLAVAVRIYDLALVLIGLVLGVIERELRSLGRLALLLTTRPMLLLVASFGVLIAVGTALLMLPISVTSVAHISFVDALFTITSAVCVTGLAVNDVATVYTDFGHAVILVGIQLGGIGIMTIAALAATFGRGSVERRAGLSQALEARNVADLRSLVRTVVTYTLAIELLGTILLWIHWSDVELPGDRSPLWLALFHAVSAFCNAGFSLFSDNLMGFVDDPYTQLVIMLLILTGGIGFAVMRELAQRARRTWLRRVKRVHVPWVRPTVATRVALLTSAALLLIGAIGLGASEAYGTLHGLSPVDQVVNATFASVTARTAGFNTLDMTQLAPPTLVLTIMLMFIGGSPGSTAGGIKTNTLAVILATLRAELKGRSPELFGRAIAPRTVRRAVAVVALSLGFVSFVLLAMTIAEPDKGFLALAFESFSAFGTAGLSVGLTPTLGVAGKLIITVAMFVGRVGPLTIAFAVGQEREAPRYRLAAEDVAVG
jgi:trk system potassium uptake protein TrkH